MTVRTVGLELAKDVFLYSVTAFETDSIVLPK